MSMADSGPMYGRNKHNLVKAIVLQLKPNEFKNNKHNSSQELCWSGRVGWRKGREAQEGGDTCMVMANPCCCVARGHHNIVEQFSPIKKQILKSWKKKETPPWEQWEKGSYLMSTGEDDNALEINADGGCATV